MYEVSIERAFWAAHAITIGGEREPAHRHNWHVRVVLEGEVLDGDGLLADFHDVERELETVLEPLRDGDLNRTPPFDTMNPTAEHVARHVATSLAGRLPGPGRLRLVTVTEAAGCHATYRMNHAATER